MAKRNKSYTWLIAVILVAVVIAALFMTGILQTATGPISVGGGDDVSCDIEPYIDNATFNEYAKGTGVGVTYYYTIEGNEQVARTLTPGTSGTAFSVGDKLTIMSSQDGYIDQIDKFTITKCGSNTFTNYVYQGDAITIDILDENYNAVTDGADADNAVNITDGGAETSADFIVRVKGMRDRSTGQVLLTFEGNDTEIDTMTIKANSAGANVIEDDGTVYNSLKLFTAEGTAPVAKFAFVVDEVFDDGQDEYIVSVTAESGETLGAADASGFLYVNAYAAQWFVDTDGTFQFGFEDSDGTLKYEQKATDHDALFS